MTPRRKRKGLSSKTPDERAKATDEFDQEFVVDTFHSMSPADRIAWNRLKRKRGRPRVGKGAKVIAVSLEKGLLAQCDRLAKKKGVSRASLIARGLKRVIAAEKAG